MMYGPEEAPDDYGHPCLYFACRERNPGTRSMWWSDYGTCGRTHAVDHYGSDVIERDGL